MSIWKKISNLFSPQANRGEANAMWVTVRCNRCGEIIRSRINLSNDLSAEYDGSRTTYTCRKVLLGESRCFQQIEVILKFDENRKLVDRVVSGGQFVTQE